MVAARKQTRTYDGQDKNSVTIIGCCFLPVFLPVVTQRGDVSVLSHSKLRGRYFEWTGTVGIHHPTFKIETQTNVSIKLNAQPEPLRSPSESPSCSQYSRNCLNGHLCKPITCLCGRLSATPVRFYYLLILAQRSLPNAATVNNVCTQMTTNGQSDTDGTAVKLYVRAIYP